MIKDRPIRIVQTLIILVEKFLLRQFARVKVIGEVNTEENKASLILFNHFSFNDGAVLHYLNRKVFKKQFKVMVVEAQMRSFWPLRYIGCFSVNKKSRNVIESLNYAASLLDIPNNMLGIFPQGEVYSEHLPRIHFEKGLTHILKKTDKPIQVIFGVMLLDYLDSFKPVMRVYLKVYEGINDTAAMEMTYNEFYKECKLAQCQLHNPPPSVLA